MNTLLAVAIDLPMTNGQNVGDTIPTFGVLVGKILNIAGIIAGVVLVFMLIYGGFLFMSAAGTTDAKKLAKAQNSLVTALIGFLIIFLSYFIIQIVEKITGITLTTI